MELFQIFLSRAGIFATSNPTKFYNFVPNLAANFKKEHGFYQESVNNCISCLGTCSNNCAYETNVSVLMFCNLTQYLVFKVPVKILHLRVKVVLFLRMQLE